MGLDRERDNIGYLLGRVLAIGDCIQSTSIGHGGPNRNFSDSFRGSLGTTPRMVLKNIDDKINFHLSKIKRNAKGLGISLHKEYSEIFGRINSVPAVLGMDDQVEFVLGYQHQYQSQFTKRSVPNA